MTTRRIKDALLGFGGVAQGMAIANNLEGFWFPVYVAGLSLWVMERLVEEEKKGG